MSGQCNSTVINTRFRGGPPHRFLHIYLTTAFLFFLPGPFSLFKSHVMSFCHTLEYLHVLLLRAHFTDQLPLLQFQPWRLAFGKLFPPLVSHILSSPLKFRSNGLSSPDHSATEQVHPPRGQSHAPGTYPFQTLPEERRCPSESRSRFYVWPVTDRVGSLGEAERRWQF